MLFASMITQILLDGLALKGASLEKAAHNAKQAM